MFRSRIWPSVDRLLNGSLKFWLWGGREPPTVLLARRIERQRDSQHRERVSSNCEIAPHQYAPTPSTGLKPRNAPIQAYQSLSLRHSA